MNRSTYNYFLWWVLVLNGLLNSWSNVSSGKVIQSALKLKEKWSENFHCNNFLDANFAGFSVALSGFSQWNLKVVDAFELIKSEKIVQEWKELSDKTRKSKKSLLLFFFVISFHLWVRPQRTSGFGRGSLVKRSEIPTKVSTIDWTTQKLNSQLWTIPINGFLFLDRIKYKKQQCKILLCW